MEQAVLPAIPIKTVLNPNFFIKHPFLLNLVVRIKFWHAVTRSEASALSSKYSMYSYS